MNKFKPGDAVVVIADSPSDPWAEKGNRGIVKATGVFWADISVELQEYIGVTVDLTEEELEHAEIVDSPLWRALK